MDPATVRVGLGSLKTDYIILLQKIHIDPKLMVSIVIKKKNMVMVCVSDSWGSPSYPS